jgi:hypothetical protein
MKKLMILAFMTNFLLSCGPKKMGCGARGICKTSQIKIISLSEKSSILQIEKI